MHRRPLGCEDTAPMRRASAVIAGHHVACFATKSMTWSAREQHYRALREAVLSDCCHPESQMAYIELARKTSKNGLVWLLEVGVLGFNRKFRRGDRT